MTESKTPPPDDDTTSERVTESIVGSGFEKRAEVFPMEPVMVMPINDIIDAAGPPLGTPIDVNPQAVAPDSTPVASTDSE